MFASAPAACYTRQVPGATGHVEDRVFKLSGRLALACSVMVVALFSASIAAAAPRVAVLGLENRSGDPRYDYIGGIAQGLLLYDLSTSGSVELLDRDAIDALLRERELSLSAIASAQVKAFEGISSADYIVAGEYVLLGTDLRLTLKLVDVATSRVATFSDAGSTENLIHGLAEGIVERLTGKRPVLREEGKSRSILSLRDETPGTIALFSPLVDARVLLDGAFVGYTTGDRRVPLVLDGLEPGVHEVSTDLGRDFGVVKLPEVSFSPWKELVRVPAGKKVVVVDTSTHFNDILYRLKQVLNESKTVAFDQAGSFATAFPFSFTDRKGVAHSGRMALDVAAPAGADAHGLGSVTVELDGASRTLALDYAEDADAEASTVMGLASFRAQVSLSYGRLSYELEAERTDVDQGMHRQDE